MPQGISPNPLNKISEVYLSQISEHHKKDADGNTIPHEDELDEAIAEAKAHDSLDNRETDWDEVREGLSTFDGVGAVGEATHMYIPKSKWEVTS